jgi:hypothetical protein
MTLDVKSASPIADHPTPIDYSSERFSPVGLIKTYDILAVLNPNSKAPMRLDIDLKDRVLVRCPLVGKNSAAECLGCPFFNSLEMTCYATRISKKRAKAILIAEGFRNG